MITGHGLMCWMQTGKARSPSRRVESCIRCIAVLYLVAKVPNSVYPKGHVLSIPEYKLDSAVRSLKRNPDFKSRYQSEALLYTDVEDIVRIASNHFIKLELEP